MLTKFFVLFLTLACTTAIKCKPASKSVQSVHTCCHAPLPSWSAFNSECSGSGSQPSCRLECIFNATSALRFGHTHLNLTHVGSMLKRAFNDEATIEAYKSNFVTCSSLVRNNYNELSQLSKQSDACDRHALFYSLCAYSRLLRSCPHSFWQGSNKQCQAVRSYVSNCPWAALKMFMSNT